MRLQVRQGLVDSFQAGELDVIVCSYGVGATGLTRTRSHTIVLLDRPWTPGDARQVREGGRREGGRGGREEWREARVWRLKDLVVGKNPVAVRVFTCL